MFIQMQLFVIRRTTNSIIRPLIEISRTQIEEYIKNSKYNQSELALIGDSMMDDVVCGNRLGITTVLTDPLGKREFPIAKMKRRKEKKIQKKLRDNNLFTKGRYYV